LAQFELGRPFAEGRSIGVYISWFKSPRAVRRFVYGSMNFAEGESRVFFNHQSNCISRTTI
jgi:hypothetical protein